MKGHQCLKALYLHKKRPFLRDKLTAEQRAKFQRGHAVGHLAHQLFPGGIDVSPNSPSQFPKAVEQTQRLIAEGQELIYEATFQYERVLVMLDILRKTPDGWIAYEVKSSKKLSETYYTDAALQHYVITQSGLPLHQFFLVYVDTDYKLNGHLDVHTFFKMEEVGARNLQDSSYIAQQIDHQKQALLDKHSPKIAVGTHCFSPYRCNFVGFCWKKQPKKSHLPPHINKAALTQLPSKFQLLSFTAWPAVVPVCENSQPYMQQLLSYKIGDNPVCLAPTACGQEQDFIRTFFASISPEDQYLVYDKSLFTGLLDDISKVYPMYTQASQQLAEHSIGFLESLEEDKRIQPADRSKLSWLYWLSWANATQSISLSPITSDAEAVLLQQKQADLLSKEDNKDIKQYFCNKHKLLQLMLHTLK